MERRLFCELSPLAYQLSSQKECILRRMQDTLRRLRFAKTKTSRRLPVLVYRHKSLIRRQLGDVDPALQENKATNLALAAPHINGVLIRPGETFSFWKLVGRCTEKKGYKTGLVISCGSPAEGIGGGMCQFTNLLHWMVLHSPLELTEHHHHNELDMFPDYGRQVPFGCGTSVFYNYVDYRVSNRTDNTFQFLVYTTDTHLCGELRALHSLPHSYHIQERDSHFEKQGDTYYRRNTVWRRVVDKRSGNLLREELLVRSNARVLYDSSFISGKIEDIEPGCAASG